MAGPEVILPLVGSFGLAGIFLAIGVISGGIWVAAWPRGRDVAGVRRWSLGAFGGAALSAAIFSAILASERPNLWIAAPILALVGCALLWGARVAK